MHQRGDRRVEEPAGIVRDLVRRTGSAEWRAGGRRAGWRRARIRRGLAALLVAVAGWMVTGALLPEEPPAGVPVVVAVHDLPVGHRLSAGDLRVSRWPKGLRPSAVYTRVDDAVGGTLAGPLSEGEALTKARMNASDLLAALPPERVMAHIPATGGLVSVLQPGDRVDALSTADGTVIGRDLLVLEAGSGPASTDDKKSAFGPLTSNNATTGRGVLVATTRQIASRLAVSLGAETPGAGVMLTLHRPG